MDEHQRRYAAFHDIETPQVLAATVVWDGQEWKVSIDGAILPDCCATIEEAFTAAEREIARQFPGHTCQSCRAWHPFADQES